MRGEEEATRGGDVGGDVGGAEMALSRTNCDICELDWFTPWGEGEGEVTGEGDGDGEKVLETGEVEKEGEGADEGGVEGGVEGGEEAVQIKVLAPLPPLPPRISAMFPFDLIIIADGIFNTSLHHPLARIVSYLLRESRRRRREEEGGEGRKGRKMNGSGGGEGGARAFLAYQVREEEEEARFFDYVCPEYVREVVERVVNGLIMVC